MYSLIPTDKGKTQLLSQRSLFASEDCYRKSQLVKIQGIIDHNWLSNTETQKPLRGYHDWLSNTKIQETPDWLSNIET